ncbi:MAG: GIY-YIG nuclease family protein [Microbacter sp.]
MYYVYILQSGKTGHYYVGSTGHLEDRIERHNGGRSKATKNGLPWTLVFKEAYSNRGEAMRREMEIKGWKSHERISAMINTYRL